MLVEMSPSGGLFQYSYQLGTQLARLGHQVELVTGPDPELASREPGMVISPVLPTWHPTQGENAPTTVRRLRRLVRGLRYAQAMLVLLVTIRRRRPDAVFFQPFRFPLDGWAVRACRLVSPTTRRCHVMHEPRPLNEQRRSGSLYREDGIYDKFLLGSTRRAVARLQGIFVLGEGARADVLKYWSPAATVTVIPHGDEDVFLSQDQSIPVDVTDPVVLFFGIWTRHKGIPQLIEAFGKVVAEVPEARLIIAGVVQADVDPEEIRALAAPFPGIELRPGYVAIEDVPKLFGQARVVAVPYLRANQSGVVHVAQSFARPIVATEVGDIPAAVRDGEGGIIVPPDDVPALTSALMELLTDRERAERLGSAGRERLTAEASWDQIAETVSRVALAADSEEPLRKVS